VRRSFVVGFLFIFLVAGLLACRTADAPRTPEETCRAACADHAARCSRDECATGCNLSLDRLAEHEGDHVLACVAAAKACDVQTWARCATLIGPHADGGPPAPPPPDHS
jgi:hypothetical protein